MRKYFCYCIFLLFIDSAYAQIKKSSLGAGIQYTDNDFFLNCSSGFEFRKKMQFEFGLGTGIYKAITQKIYFPSIYMQSVVPIYERKFFHFNLVPRYQFMLQALPDESSRVFSKSHFIYPFIDFSFGNKNRIGVLLAYGFRMEQYGNSKFYGHFTWSNEVCWKYYF